MKQNCIDFQDSGRGGRLGFSIPTSLAIYKSPGRFLPSFQSTVPGVKEDKAFKANS